MTTADAITKHAATQDKDRRRYVRAHDAIELHVQRLVDLPAAGQVASSDEVVQPSLRQRRKNKYTIDGYAEVRRDYPAVADYISDLEERIRELLLDVEVTAGQPTHKVNLSAGGLSFSDKNLFFPGEVVSLSMTLFPSGQLICTDAVIVAGNESDEVGQSDELTYRAEFIRLPDCDRIVIEEHVGQLQARRMGFHD